jgi:hypothetical protein
VSSPLLNLLLGWKTWRAGRIVISEVISEPWVKMRVGRVTCSCLTLTFCFVSETLRAHVDQSRNIRCVAWMPFLPITRTFTVSWLVKLAGETKHIFAMPPAYFVSACAARYSLILLMRVTLTMLSTNSLT